MEKIQEGLTPAGEFETRNRNEKQGRKIQKNFLFRIYQGADLRGQKNSDCCRFNGALRDCERAFNVSRTHACSYEFAEYDFAEYVRMLSFGQYFRGVLRLFGGAYRRFTVFFTV